MTRKTHKIYLKRVATLLRQTGHPRRSEVLDDLQAHLEDLATTTGEAVTLEQLLEQFGTPEEYAESLAPAEGFSPKPWYRRGRVQLTLITTALLGMFVLLGWLTIFPDRYYVKAHVRQALGANFVAPSPFFDLKAARNLQAGVDGQAIRDAIGYPWKRYRGDPSLSDWEQEIYYGDSSFAHLAEVGEIIWEYTRSPEVESPFYTICNIITDEEEHLLRVESRQVKVLWDVRDQVFSSPHIEEGKSSSFRRQAKHELVLRADNPNIYLISNLNHRARESVEEAVTRREAEISALWGNLDTEELRFIYTTGPLTIDQELWDEGRTKDAIKKIAPEIFTAMMNALAPELPVYDSWAAGRLYRGDSYAMKLYHRGTLYQFPPLLTNMSSPDPSDISDQVWLLHRLLAQ